MDANKIREIRLIRGNPRFRRYPEYKESSVEWIGEIPAHWNLAMLKYAARLVYGDTLTSENRKNGIVPVYGSNGIIDTHSAANTLSPVIIVGRKGSLGKIQYSDVPCFVIDTAYYIDRRASHVNLRWLHYVLQALKLERFRNSVLPGLNRESAEGQYVPLITIDEQIQIATFLDRKTEQIDEFIRLKERRIELLQEQRTALINQAVTKGLDPDVEMKPSGVEWIGEIPKHWEINRLKYVAKILPSNVDKHIYPDEIQVKLCNYTDVYYNDYITVDSVLEKGSCNEREFTKFVLRKGDVIITKDSETPDDIGVPTFVKDNLDNVVCGYHLTMIRPLVCRGEFIFRFIQSDRTRRYFEVNSNGITRYGLGKASIENLLLPIPPDSEQLQIADFLNQKTKQIDELIVAELQKIELLKEYRQSVISEAVTGKIDVRNGV